MNFATNYFAVGHPSLTNYLEVVGGSNFGVRSDNPPDWGNTMCKPNIVTKIVNADNNGGNAPIKIDTGDVCPIAGTGEDAETPAVDNWNEVGTDANGKVVIPYLADIDGIKSVGSGSVDAETIADQLVKFGLTWKTYQESLPLGTIYGVNYSNGSASNLTDPNSILPLVLSKAVVQDYAVKHNPFAYFNNVQEELLSNKNFDSIVGFDGPHGLFADLATGDVPSFSFIVPNQCNDQHGRSNADAFCAFDFGDANGFTYGTQVGLNPGLILEGDVTIERLVEGIHASPAWHQGRNVIIIVWDENDYSGITTKPNGLFPPQNQNKVVLTVEPSFDTDDLGRQSSNYYNSFSLLRTLEKGFGLPCLNHACDKGVFAMTGLFGGQ